MNCLAAARSCRSGRRQDPIPAAEQQLFERGNVINQDDEVLKSNFIGDVSFANVDPGNYRPKPGSLAIHAVGGLASKGSGNPPHCPQFLLRHNRMD
jgi:hypothetical protein